MTDKTPSSQNVLIVVDMQKGVVRNHFERDKRVQNAASVVAKARENHVPIIWVQHDDDELIKHSDDWQLADGLTAQEGDILISKNFNSSFEQTELAEKLKALEVRKVVLAGAASNWCIRATAYGALERGYDLLLVGDAHTTGDIKLDSGTLHAKDIITELNINLNWVEYPDRTSKVLNAGEISF